MNNEIDTDYINNARDALYGSLASSCDACYRNGMYKDRKPIPETVFVLRVLKNSVFSCADIKAVGLSGDYDFRFYVEFADMGAKITEMFAACEKCNGEKPYISEFIETLKPVPV